jgi:hypothetical protein
MVTVSNLGRLGVSLEKKNSKGGGKQSVWSLPPRLIILLLGKLDRGMRGRNLKCTRKWMLLLDGEGRGYCTSALVLLICESPLFPNCSSRMDVDDSDPDEIGRRKYRGLEFLSMAVGDLFE